MRKLIQIGLGSVLLAGSLAVAPPAQAATQHCPSSYTNKVEVGGDDASVPTSLRNGTRVCIKAGNQIMFGYVSGGYVTNTDIRNDNGVLKGISYYSWQYENPS